MDREVARKRLKFMAFFSGASMIIGLGFLSPNVTGRVVGNLSLGSSTLLGIALTVMGVLGFWFFSKFMNSYL